MNGLYDKEVLRLTSVYKMGYKGILSDKSSLIN